MKANNTLIDVLNNTAGRRLVNCLEDIISSLDSYNGNEPELVRIGKNVQADIYAQFGYKYVHNYLK